MNNSVAEAEHRKSIFGRISQSFWGAFGRGDTDKYIFFVISIFILHMLIILAVNKTIPHSNFYRTHLSPFYFSYALAVMKLYAVLLALLLAGGVLLKILRKDVSVLVYIVCFGVCFAHLHQVRFTGFHLILFPLMLLVDITCIVLLFGHKTATITLLFSSSLFLGVLVLEQLGLLTVPSVVLNTVKFNDMFGRIHTVVLLAGFSFTITSLTGLVLVHSFKLINMKTEELNEEYRRTQRLSSKLSLYLPKILVDLLERGEAEVDLRHERKRLTIFLSDIKDFTKTSEIMQPEELSKILNLYLTRMCDIAEEYDGTVDKFIGDAILIYFGGIGDDDYKNHALQAVRMSIAMQKEMDDINEELERDGFDLDLKIRIGVNTGYTTIGSFGSKGRMDYTVIGKEVNVASRLETACDPGSVLVSHSTYGLTKDTIEYEAKGEVYVKGIQNPLRVYKVISEQPGLL